MFSHLATPPSSEELTWLHASALLNPSFPDDDINSQSDRLSLCSMSLGVPPSKTGSSSPLKPVSRSEWIYRTPKSLPVPNSSPCPARGHYPSSLSRSRSNAGEKAPAEDSDDISSFSSKSLLSAILHPRTRPDCLSVPPLRPIPSESLLTFTPPELTPSTTTLRLSHVDTPSLPPAFDSSLLSHSPTSSRSDSPVTPISISSTCRTGRRRSYDLPRHRPRRSSHSAEIPRTSTTQSSPSKSILTRTASLSTRASSHTVNKSVKFATIPTVHYATRAYWDKDIADTDSVGINIDSMDLDDDPFANYRSREGSVLEADEKSFVIQPRPATSTSERSKHNPKRVKRLVRLARKSVSLVHDNNPASERPIISSPYALGSYPTNAYHVDGADSSSSLISRPWTTSSLSFRRSSEAAGSASSVVLPIKNGLSYESLRRSKTSGADSLRSLESTSSRTERFRTWLSRSVGWTPA